MTIDTYTGEIVDDNAGLSESDARTLLGRVKVGLGYIQADLIALYHGRGWTALGYASWDAMFDAELDGARIALPRAQRVEVVQELRQAGLSTRAIGSAVGVSHQAVQRDLGAGGPSGPPAATTVTVTGVDGKAYSVRPVAAPRAPRTDVVLTITRCLSRASDAADLASEIKPAHLRDRGAESAEWADALGQSITALTALHNLMKGTDS